MENKPSLIRVKEEEVRNQQAESTDKRTDTHEHDISNDDVKQGEKSVVQKPENASQQARLSVERSQEAKLMAKYPAMKSTTGGSDFLKKRLSKGRVYFDSGEYNMSKSKIENRSSTKVHSKEPTLIRMTSTDDEDAENLKPMAHGEKDNPLPEPEETAQQAIPTPELLFLRRASLHMPMSSSEAQSASMPGLDKRRYTAAPKGLMATEESPAFPAVFESEGMPPLFSENMSRRRATLQVPSKLAMQ